MHAPAGSNRRRGPVRVVVVADSAENRAELVRTLEADGDIAVSGQAADTADALRQVHRVRPDVVTIDLPEGLRQHAVEQIMNSEPTPILVVWADSHSLSSTNVADLIQAGALGTLPRPSRSAPTSEADVRRQVRLLRGVTVVRHPRSRNADVRSPSTEIPPAPGGRSIRLVAVAASTGGPAALATVLSGLQGVVAPVLVVQHIQAEFVAGLVSWMDRVAAIPVHLAVDGETLVSGVAYIGPADVHLKLGPGMRVELDPNPPTRHRPSADQLFFSVARYAGPAAVGVVLTGMGDDGAEGLLAMRRQGALTIVQDQATSAVFGMPQAATLLGAASEILPLDQIASAVAARARRR